MGKITRQELAPTLRQELDDVYNYIQGSNNAEFGAHMANRSNPHGVTKDQIGLGNVSNVLQASKTEFIYLASDFTEHVNNVSNPHFVTKAHVGLGNVSNVLQASKAEFDSHKNNKNNPHGVTVAQIGAVPNIGGEVTSYFRASGTGAPKSGSGVEIKSELILSYDRSRGRYLPLDIRASEVTIIGRKVYTAGDSVKYGSSAPSGGNDGDIWIQY